MSVKSPKKRKTFVDLSDDDFEIEQAPAVKVLKPPVKSSPVVKKIIKPLPALQNIVNEKKIDVPSKEIIENEKTKEKNQFVEKPIETSVNNENKVDKLKESTDLPVDEAKSVVIKEAFEIVSEEPLNKGFHFYSNDRVMNKVKRLAKSKNIKLSKLITMILDKAIREE